MCLDYGLCYEQTETHTALVKTAALIALVKSFKHEGQILCGDSGALVVDLDGQLFAVIGTVDGKAQKAALL